MTLWLGIEVVVRGLERNTKPHRQRMRRAGMRAAAGGHLREASKHESSSNAELSKMTDRLLISSEQECNA